jgi:hypothetical protein
MHDMDSTREVKPRATRYLLCVDNNRLQALQNRKRVARRCFFALRLTPARRTRVLVQILNWNTSGSAFPQWIMFTNGYLSLSAIL